MRRLIPVFEKVPPLAVLLFSAICLGQQPATEQTQSQAPVASESPAPLRVMVGKSLLINTTDRLKRVSVTDPDVADALVVTATQVLVHGRSPGEVSLLIWDEYERSRSFDLRVDVDVTAAAEEIKRIFPDEQIDVSASRSAIVLSGHVTTEDVEKHAGMVAAAYSKNVINVLSFGPVGAQEVLLEVKFAEVDRTAVTQLGVNLFSTGAANTVGTSTTGQFGGFQVSRSGGATTGTTSGGTTGGSETTINLNQALNLFLFRSDINLQVVPEVSQLDFTNALTISGFTIPALSTRRAQTEFEVQDGQSFVIAGLMDNRVTDQYSKVPGLGDIPVLGNLFRSKNAQKSATELVVLCTVHRISASTEPAPTPKYPQPFMDKGKFDGPSATGGGK